MAKAATLAAVAAALFALLPAAGTSGRPTSASTAGVTIKPTSANYKFVPRVADVPVRGKVRWTWRGSAPHNVTFTKVPRGASKRSSDTTEHGNFSRSFSKAGTYKYECTIHNFSGRVIAG